MPDPIILGWHCTVLGEAWLITRLQKLPPARYIPIHVTLQLISRQTLTPPQFLVITQNCSSASKDVLSQASVNTLQHQLIWQQKWGDQQKLTNSKSEARHWSWWWHDWSSGVITLGNPSKKKCEKFHTGGGARPCLKCILSHFKPF